MEVVYQSDPAWGTAGRKQPLIHVLVHIKVVAIRSITQ
jgi:hypothetical protein